MKKRWTFKLIIDTQFQSDEWTEDVELMTEKEASKRVKDDLEYMLEDYPYALELLKFEMSTVE